jgi:hypothetical protein
MAAGSTRRLAGDWGERTKAQWPGANADDVPTGTRPNRLLLAQWTVKLGRFIGFDVSIQTPSHSVGEEYRNENRNALLCLGFNERPIR